MINGKAFICKQILSFSSIDINNVFLFLYFCRVDQEFMPEKPPTTVGLQAS